MAPTQPMLVTRGLSKRFGVARVLTEVSLEIGRNQVVGLVGENGAGKSTLLNILSGIVQPDAGEILLDGHPIRPSSHAEAAALGVSRVFQEQALIPNIRVYENLLLSHEERFTRFG
jgi:ribose transport system ATP-binding protein